ncbi:hypothetical protein SSX86_009787 [Deinandra increscens subsp. villosa]|uniref:Serine aminopeptidase S33 domain-containing protein n=1 Tax=Deinandra increscens subsp. villosa TaxID=3103831 RepID=A0AAP0H3E2_9ASTR
MATGDSTTTSATINQNPGIKQQQISIQNNHGEKLVGLLHETRSEEIVVVCHGFQCTKEYSIMVDLCFALEKQGISAFRFDFSGNGESEGLFQFGNYHKEVDDLHAVIQHFTAANRVVSAIIGHSKGGNVVVLYASIHHDIKKVVNVSGRYKMDRGIEELLGKYYLERAKKDGFIDFKSISGEFLLRATYTSIMERLNTNMHEAGLKVDQECRVLTVHGSADEVIPVEDALEFAKIIPNHELKIIEGADHCYNKHRDELALAVLAFIKDNMERRTYSTLKQRLPISNHSHTLTLNTTRTRIKLEMAAGAGSGESTTSGNLNQNPGVEQERIIIQNNCGEKLVGLLHETGSKEIVILCHGFRDSKDYNMMVELAFALEKDGISAFRFDFSGNGESEGVFQFGNYRKEVDDLQAVIQHLTGENRVISAILGHSKGGNVVVLYASLHHNVQTVVNVSGRYKMDRGVEERLGKDYLERAKEDGFIGIKSRKGGLLFRATYESIMERLNTNMHEAGLKVDQDCRVLTVHGSVDEVIPVEDALEFAKIIPNHELRIIDGANHNYNNHRDELVSVVSAFLKDNMHRA